MFLILTQFSVAVLAGLGLDFSFKWVMDNNNDEIVKKLALICGAVVLIIIGLKLYSI